MQTVTPQQTAEQLADGLAYQFYGRDTYAFKLLKEAILRELNLVELIKTKQKYDLLISAVKGLKA